MIVSLCLSFVAERGFVALEFGEELLSVDALAMIEGSQTPIHLPAELGKPGNPNFVTILQESQRLADNFTGGVVAAGLHFVVNKLFQLGGEIDIHEGLPLWFWNRTYRTYPSLSVIGNG